MLSVCMLFIPVVSLYIPFLWKGLKYINLWVTLSYCQTFLNPSCRFVERGHVLVKMEEILYSSSFISHICKINAIYVVFSTQSFAMTIKLAMKIILHFLMFNCICKVHYVFISSHSILSLLIYIYIYALLYEFYFLWLVYQLSCSRMIIV